MPSGASSPRSMIPSITSRDQPCDVGAEPASSISLSRALKTSGRTTVVSPNQ